MKRRWKRIFAGLLAALMLCLCPCFAGAAPPEDLPALKTFRYATSGMCIEEFNRYQIKETARGRFAWIELHNDDHYVLPLTDEDMASFSALVQELGLAEWNGYHKIDHDVLDGASFSLSVEFEDGWVIDASGSNCFPRGYSEKASAIRDFFEKLMEEYGFDLNDLWLWRNIAATLPASADESNSLRAQKQIRAMRQTEQEGLYGEWPQGAPAQEQGAIIAAQAIFMNYLSVQETVLQQQCDEETAALQINAELARQCALLCSMLHNEQ